MNKENQNAGAVDVSFTVPAFRYNGQEYKSAEVEKAVEEGDEDAAAMVADLVKIGSGVVSVKKAEVKAPKAQKGSRAPKAVNPTAESPDEGQKAVKPTADTPGEGEKGGTE